MSDNTYSENTLPYDFHPSPIINVFIQHLLQPYRDVLAPADSKESLIEWVQAVLPEHHEDIIANLGDLDLEQTKIQILHELEQYLVLEGGRTPWDISSNRNEISERLFGPKSDTLPVHIVHGENIFQHDLTEELTYGILIGLVNSPDFAVYFFGIPLDHSQLDERYVVQDEQLAAGNFAVNYGDSIITFTTPQFIQGVVTASEWVNTDPHTIVTNLRQLDENLVVTPLTF